MATLHIAVDAMGGDHGTDVTLPGARLALERNPDLTLTLVGPEESLGPWMDALPDLLADRIRVCPERQVVGMADRPSQALRMRSGSTMGRAVAMVHSGEAVAAVSAGNTGALMALSRYQLKTLPGIDRPAICSALPSVDGWTYVLDLGANVAVQAENLLQFGVMGSAVAKIAGGIDNPRIGLLNVGIEAIKGTDSVRQAAPMLEDSGLNYIGFVEGDDIFQGQVDVVVCDGFVGNVALKASEGLSRLLMGSLRHMAHSGLGGRMAATAAMPALRQMGRKFDPRHYNGASLVGLTGIVIKSHGSTDDIGFANAIDTAALEGQAGLPGRIGDLLGDVMSSVLN